MPCGAPPLVFGATALLVLLVCVLLGGVYHNGYLAMAGLAAPILAGVGYLLALRRERAGQPIG